MNAMVRCSLILVCFAVLGVTLDAQTNLCPGCYYNLSPMAGHGSASAAGLDPGDNRRVITVRIDPTWTNPATGKTVDSIWNAANCAVNEWNVATDANGNHTGYYFVVDQSGTYSATPDITVKQGVPVNSHFASTSGASGGPYVTTLAQSDAGLDAGSLCGTIGHEIGHNIGDAEANQFCSGSIMGPANLNGSRANNVPSTDDVAYSNDNLTGNQQGLCTKDATKDGGEGDGGDGSQPGGGSCTPPQPSCSNLILATCDTTTGKWQCDPGECLGDPPTCSDGTPAVCYNGGWDCGTVTISCTPPPPTCPDGTTATCNSDTWVCAPCTDVCNPNCSNYNANDPSCSPCSDVCDPSCANYDPSDPSCGGGCSDPCDPSCSDYDPSDPSCGGGGGGGCADDCCMSVSPCDIACMTVPPSQRQFWNTGAVALLGMPAKARSLPTQCASVGGRAVKSAKPSLRHNAADTIRIVDRLKLPRASAAGDLSPTAFQLVAADAASRGNPAAPITIVEFSDFECPFCKVMETTLTQVLPSQESNVRLVYKHFPLSFHPWAEKAAEISECARRQDENAFWQVHDYIFEHQASLRSETLEQELLNVLDQTHKVNVRQAKECIDAHQARSTVMLDAAQGQQNGVHGTPTLFVNGIRVTGAQNATLIQKAIEQARASLKPASNARSSPPQPVRDGNQSDPFCALLDNERSTPCLF
jgi:protein-disulfide isomerase